MSIQLDDVSSAAAIPFRGIVHTLIVDFLRLARSFSAQFVFSCCAFYWFCFAPQFCNSIRFRCPFSSRANSFFLLFSRFRVFCISQVSANIVLWPRRQQNNEIHSKSLFVVRFSLIKCDRSGISRFFLALLRRAFGSQWSGATGDSMVIKRSETSRDSIVMCFFVCYRRESPWCAARICLGNDNSSGNSSRLISCRSLKAANIFSDIIARKETSSNRNR